MASVDKIVIVVSHEVPEGLDMRTAEVVRILRDGNRVVIANPS